MAKKKKKKLKLEELLLLETEGPRGNPPVIEEYEDARENAMINRDVPTMKHGGSSSCGCEECMGASKARGAGAAISGTGFKGVF